MDRLGQVIRDFVAPAIPEAIHDDFVRITAGQLQKRCRLLFAAMLITTPTALFAASSGASVWIRYVAPMAMALFCLLGIASLSRDLKLNGSIRRSVRLIRESTVTSLLIAAMCSAWCVHSWLGAPPHERIYYPVIIALGAFSTAYCLSSVRLAAIGNLAINLLPMLVLLFSSGTRMDLAAGISLAVTAAFQLHMIVQHQTDILNLLQLQRYSRELSMTDPLTGLLNRRALLDNALAMGEEGSLRLMLVDIDHFKAINDGHGHDQGDAVLVEVASQLAQGAELRGCVARIGGEEFAILGDTAELPAALALGLVAAIRTAAMPHGGQVTISIGIAEGPVTDSDDWRDLFNRADAALYQAKADGRNRVVEGAPPRSTETHSVAA